MMRSLQVILNSESSGKNYENLQNMRRRIPGRAREMCLLWMPGGLEFEAELGISRRDQGRL